MQFKRRSNFSALVYMSKNYYASCDNNCTLHCILSMVFNMICFLQTSFPGPCWSFDRERVQLCWIYWWIFIAIFQLHRYRHKALLYFAFMLFPSGACSDLRFSCLGKNLKYPVFILIKSILSYYDIGLPSCMRSSNYLIIDTLTHQNTSTQFIN